eukprot:TRINITY_DN12399_c0_g1_i1.p1 TRINITY_DN12399_c0_g1~~TRINITY_DN12399_c0_g1_i1.p1  ORF type:complete len:260 (-),score=30.92 TRINITY_DN12399_c0_g1_i1:138-917(-)
MLVSNSSRQHFRKLIMGLWLAFLSLSVPALIVYWASAKDILLNHAGFSLSFLTEDEMWRTLNWHPLLMSLAFSVFGTSAITSYKLISYSTFAKKIIHGFLHFLALSCASLGFYIVLRFKNESKNDQFYSLHSYFGIFVLVCYTANFLIGFVSFILLQHCCENSSRNQSFRAWIVTLHRFFGVSFYAASIVTAITGFLDRQSLLKLMAPEISVYSSAYVLTNMLGLMNVFIIASVLFALYYLKRPLAEDDYSLIVKNEDW